MNLRIKKHCCFEKIHYSWTDFVKKTVCIYCICHKITATNHRWEICILGLAKQDLWGLGAESQCFVASFPFAKMIPPIAMGESFWQKIHYDSAPRPKRSRFAHPNVYNLALLLYCTYLLTNCDIHFFALLHGMHYPISG